jgi:hypothetical protein
MADTDTRIIIRPPTNIQLEEAETKKEFGGATMPFSPLSKEDRQKEEGDPPPQQASISAQIEKSPARKQTTGLAAALFNSPVGAIFTGFNNALSNLTDPAINAVVKGMETAGIVEPGTVNRDVLLRIFNSGDFEQMKTIIPYVLSYGMGDYVGSTSDDSFLYKLAESGGEGLGYAAPVIATGGILAPGSAAAGSASAIGAQQAARSQVAKGNFLKEPLKTAGAYGNLAREQIIGQYIKAPGTAVALDASLSALSGVGAEGEKQLFGTQTGAGAFGLPLFGPALFYGGKALITKGPLGYVVRKTKDVTSGTYDDYKVATGKIDPKEGKKGERAEAQLTDELEQAVSSQRGKENLEKAIEIENRMELYGPMQLTPAEQTLDAPLLATQARAEKTGVPDFTRRNLDRKTTALETIQKFRDNELTGGAVDDAPLYVYNRATNEYEAQVVPIDDEMGDVTAQISLLANQDTGVYPTLTGKRNIVGENIREAVVKAKKDALAQAEKLANKKKLNSTEKLASVGATAEAREAVRNEVMTRQGVEAESYDQVPSIIKKFIDSTNKQISFQDWKLFRSQVGDAIAEASAKGKNTQTRQLIVLAKSLDDMATTYGKTNENFQDYIQWYKANVIDPFERSGVIKITAKGAGSSKDKPVYWVAGENAANAFLENTNTASQFMRLFGENPEQLRNMRSVVMDKIRQLGYNATKGEFKPEAINKYINDNNEKLQVLGLLDEVTDAESLILNQLQRNKVLTDRRRAIQQNKTLAAIASAMQRNDPERLLDTALKNPQMMSELRDIIVNKGVKGLEADEASNAFRAAVMQRLLKDTPDAVVDPKKLKELISRHERVLDAAFDKSHVNNMYLVADAYERVLATGFGLGPGIAPKDVIADLTAKIGTTPAGASNRIIAQAEGRIGPKAVAGYLLSRAVSQQSTLRADALFRDMMFDPQIAKTLTTEIDQKVAGSGLPTQVANRLRAYMFSTGIAYGPLDREGDKFQEVTLQPTRESTVPEPAKLPVTIPAVKITAPPIENDPILEENRSPRNDPAFQESIQQSQQPPGAPVSAMDLFPFDPTLAAIERRRSPNKTGIMSLT